MFFDGVVDPLDKHAGQVGPPQQIGHRSTVTKRVYRPPTARGYTCDSKEGAGISGLCSDERKRMHLLGNHWETLKVVAFYHPLSVKLHLLHMG